MTESFPLATRRELGYRIDEVEAFLGKARAAYEQPSAPNQLTAADIRLTAFRLQKRGYAVAEVDAALERLEDAFAARERRERLEALGEAEWIEEVRGQAQVLTDRLSRPAHQRFQRVSKLTVGYRIDEVDAFADRVTRHFTEGAPVSLAEVRSVSFRAQRGGYREAQVDLVIDSVVEVLQAVR
ncbi:MAG TPA: DivIVA domain-containing protein [Candidatus Lumbricidophila sp.]|nr:DivIVA domain-containing protein [Candidatus Lumbricidophila sp.]